MSEGKPAATLDSLKASAQERLESERAGRTRVAVQVGHCSRSVGAQEVASALSNALPQTAYLVETGCDGACFNAPQVLVTDPSGLQTRFAHITPDSTEDISESISTGGPFGGSNEAAFFDGQHRLAMDLSGEIDAADVDEYILHGGYNGLARALAMTPEEAIEEVEASGLRGRGGAYFPAALKWKGVRGIDKSPKYLVVNSEEGEPCVFKDRHLMEGVPHRILEGTAIAAYAAGTEKAYIYINAEANLSAERIEQAIEQACRNGLLGDNILGSGFSLDIEVRRGAGGYVCGEETTLLNTMEGYRREPRIRPPFPTESGLWAKPTVINNPETLCSVPFILSNGASAFAAVGTDSDKGTKLISLSGAVQRPGVAEVPMGTTIRDIIFDIGGGPQAGHELTAIAVGGPSSGVFPVGMLDTAIKPGMLHESGVMLGAGGVVALDERMTTLEVLRNLAGYNADESCGKCTPCREGTPRMVVTIDKLMGGRGRPGDLDELRYLARVIGLASLCGLGQAAGGPVNSVLHFFGDELAEKAGVA